MLKSMRNISQYIRLNKNNILCLKYLKKVVFISIGLAWLVFADGPKKVLYALSWQHINAYISYALFYVAHVLFMFSRCHPHNAPWCRHAGKWMDALMHCFHRPWDTFQLGTQMVMVGGVQGFPPFISQLQSANTVADSCVWCSSSLTYTTWAVFIQNCSPVSASLYLFILVCESQVGHRMFVLPAKLDTLVLI